MAAGRTFAQVDARQHTVFEMVRWLTAKFLVYKHNGISWNIS